MPTSLTHLTSTSAVVAGVVSLLLVSFCVGTATPTSTPPPQAVETTQEPQDMCGRYTKIVCEGNHDVIINCPVGSYAVVLYANYGRTEGYDEVCPPVENSTEQSGQERACLHPLSTSLIMASCQGQRSCSFESSDSQFGDPCTGVHKYLEIRYKCVGGPCPDNLPPKANDTNEADVDEPRRDDSDTDGYFDFSTLPEFIRTDVRPLGMQSCLILDTSISASSSAPGFAPVNARPMPCSVLQMLTGWKPEPEDPEPYIQVKFLSEVELHGVGILGQYDDDCWVTSYLVAVSGDGVNFNILKDKETEENLVFEGNTKRNQWRQFCLHRYYGNPVRARYVRIIPVEDNGCIGLRFELYGQRDAEDQEYLEALPQDVWTFKPTGCPCYYDHMDFSCACCEFDGCQCHATFKHQCVQCGSAHRCGIPEVNRQSDEIDGWTKRLSGCQCDFDTLRFDCACCKNLGCQCGDLNKNQCANCADMRACGHKEHIFGPNEYCVPKTCET